MKAAGYIRVSTDEQAQDGGSLDVQEAKICSYCEYNKGLELVEILTDAGISGGKSRGGMARVHRKGEADRSVCESGTYPAVCYPERFATYATFSKTGFVEINRQF